MELDEKTKQQISDFQVLQQQAQLLALQKNQTKLQIQETDKALEEVKKGGEHFFKMVGSVLIPKEKEKLQKELSEEKEKLERTSSLIEKQEKNILEKLNNLKAELEKKFKQPPEGGDKLLYYKGS